MTSKKTSSNKKVLIIGLVTVSLVVIVAAYMYIKNSSDKSKTCTTYNGAISKQCIEDYIGLSRDNAVNKAKQNGMTPIITMVDGKAIGVLDIRRDNPIYFEVNDDLVTRAYFEPATQTN